MLKWFKKEKNIIKQIDFLKEFYKKQIKIYGKPVIDNRILTDSNKYDFVSPTLYFV